MGSEVLSSQCASLVRAICLVILCWHLNTTFAHISCPGAFDQRKCSTKRSADIAQRELMWWERAEMGKEANGLAALSRQCFTQCPCTYTALAILHTHTPHTLSPLTHFSVCTPENTSGAPWVSYSSLLHMHCCTCTFTLSLETFTCLSF